MAGILWVTPLPIDSWSLLVYVFHVVVFPVVVSHVLHPNATLYPPFLVPYLDANNIIIVIASVPIFRATCNFGGLICPSFRAICNCLRLETYIHLLLGYRGLPSLF